MRGERFSLVTYVLCEFGRERGKVSNNRSSLRSVSILLQSQRPILESWNLGIDKEFTNPISMSHCPCVALPLPMSSMDS